MLYLNILMMISAVSYAEMGRAELSGLRDRGNHKGIGGKANIGLLAAPAKCLRKVEGIGTYDGVYHPSCLS